MVKIVISGPEGSGKTKVAAVIIGSLYRHGAELIALHDEEGELTFPLGEPVSATSDTFSGITFRLEVKQ